MAGFPTLIALHSVGMGMVVGLALMATWRMYGGLQALELRILPGLLTIALWGFALNFVTGIALFISRAADYSGSLMFLSKMLLVAVGVTALLLFRQRIVDVSPDAGVAADRVARVLSLLSSIFLVTAVVAGRLIAYLSDLY